MVMATYSPQYVGQEFVRQYYTMLNKDPLKLHSFYVSHSVFTHGTSSPGKVEKPVTGLQAIRDKICQLNFQNCRANIKSLDSHPTIGGGVVVQVSGELSNAECPMRKFTQTFVLAPKDPDNFKKYFVFNDIFRYQDEVFEETEEETHEETVESYAEEHGHYENQPATAHHIIPNNAQQTEFEPSLPSQAEQVVPINVLQVEASTTIEIEEEVTVDNVAVDQSAPEPADEEIVAVEHVSVEEQAPVEVVIEEEPVDNGPVSWASVLKKNSTQAQGQVKSSQVAKPQSHTPVAQPQSNSSGPQQQQQQQKRKDDTTTAKPSNKDNETGFPSKRSSSASLSDSCQIFIGNLPHGIQEADVRNAFKDFGKIVEVRLNSKSFGFVAFEAAESAQEALDLPKGKIIIDNKEINIEKKRASAGSGRPFNRRDRNEQGVPRKNSGPGSSRGPRSGPRGAGRGGLSQESGGERTQRGSSRGGRGDKNSF